MAGPEELITEIAIAGEDDVIAALGRIGEAGEEAFKKLEEATLDASGVLGAIVIGITGVYTALGILAETGAHATQAISGLATQLGATVEEVSTMQMALGAAGASTEGLGLAMRRLSLGIEREWTSIQDAIKHRTDTIIRDQLRVQQSTIGVQEAVIGYKKAMGQEVDPRDEQQLKREQAAQRLQEAVQAQVEARKKQQEDQRNDPLNVINQIDRVIAGEQNLAKAGEKINVNQKNVWTGIVGGAEGAAEAIKNFDGDVTQLARASPQVTEVLKRMADFFHNSGDAAMNSAIGMRELGRNSTSLVQRLSELGGTGLVQLQQRFRDLGFEVSKEDAAISKNFNKALNTVREELTALRDQMSTPFQKVFTDALKQIQDFVEKNRESLVKWANDMAQKVRPAVDGFINMLKGLSAAIGAIKLDPKDIDAKAWQETFESIGRFVSATKREIEALIQAIKDLRALFKGGGDKESGGDGGDARQRTGGGLLPGAGSIAGGMLAGLLRGGPTTAAVGGIIGNYATGGDQGLVTAVGGGLAGSLLGRLLGPLAGRILGTGVGASVGAGAAGAGATGLLSWPILLALGGAAGLTALSQKISPTKDLFTPGDRLLGGGGGDDATEKNTEATQNLTAKINEEISAIKQQPQWVNNLKSILSALPKSLGLEDKTVTVRRPTAAPEFGTKEYTVPGRDGDVKVQVMRPRQPDLGGPEEYTVPSGAGGTTGVTINRPTRAPVVQPEQRYDVPTYTPPSPFRTPPPPPPPPAETPPPPTEIPPIIGPTETPRYIPVLPAPPPIERGPWPPPGERHKFGENVDEDVEQPLKKVGSAATSTADTLTQAVETIKQAAASFAERFNAIQPKQQASGESAAQESAEGGIIHGPGGVDNVPAWLTAGEGVVTTRAMSHYGGEGFINAINQLKVPKFSLGGIVDYFNAQITPRYAYGGMVAAGTGGGGRPIELHIGGEKIGGLTANEDAAAAISRIAVDRAVRSGYSGSGKSSWYRGS